MPTDMTMNMAALIVAIRKWKLTFRDVKKAFGQSMPSNRARPLACRQPRTGMFPSCTDPRQLIRLNTEVYGLVSGPAWWRVTFVRHFLEQSYALNVHDPCALTLPSARSDAKGRLLTDGLAVLEMDDVCDGGSNRHQAAMAKIAQKVDFGKMRCVHPNNRTEARKPPEERGTLFNGRRWW